MSLILRLAKGESGFRGAGYRHDDGQTVAAMLVSSATLTVPGVPTVSNVGTGGAVTYSYRITALSGIGETTAGTAGTTATGNATLDGTNYNRVTWTAVTGATGYKVYGRTAGTELLMSTVFVTVPGGSTKIGGGVINVNAVGNGFEDKGIPVTPAGALPGANTGKTWTIRIPYFRQGPSGGTNWVKTGVGANTHRLQTGCIVIGR
jgi:hypothetical protein